MSSYQIIFWFLYELPYHEISIKSLYKIVIDNIENCGKIHWAELNVLVNQDEIGFD